MEGGLRKRANGHRDGNTASRVEKKEEGYPSTPPASNQPQGPPSPSSSKPWNLARWIYLLVHISAVGCFILGFIFRIQLHSGEECQMTYSHRRFLEIDTPVVSTNSISSQYKLYKFVDQRDPRYQRLLRVPQPISESHNWCGITSSNSNSTTASSRRIVLYIPGHWGSFEQARSVGAHGIQLTGQRDDQHSMKVHNALKNELWSGMAEKEEDFVYDVYTVDFAEQGGALHGQFLLEQSAYVASIVEYIVKTCEVSSISILAHSMGGYVARLTPILHPSTQPFLHNIITLATPHSNPLYGFDESIYELHQKLLTEQHDDTLIVSISGGLRDEMIAPSACHANHAVSSFTALSTKLMPHGSLGMDHRAIVWCHSLLHVVRRVIWTLSISDKEVVGERLKQVQSILGQDREAYQEHLQDMDHTFRASFGYWKVICIESAMIYNLPLLLGLYAIIGGLNCALPSSPPTWLARLIPVVAVLCGWMWTDDVIRISVIILSLLASTVYGCLKFTMMRQGFPSPSNNRMRLVGLLSFGVFLTTQVLGVVYSRVFHHEWALQPLHSVLYVSCILFALVLTISLSSVGRNERSSFCGQQPVAFASSLIVLLPVAVSGKLALIAWEGEPRASSWYFLWRTLGPVCLLCLLRRNNGVGTAAAATSSSRGRSWNRVRSAILVTAVVVSSPWILARGAGFRTCYLLPFIACVDIVGSFVLG